MFCNHLICKKSIGKRAACVLVIEKKTSKILLGYEKSGRNKKKYNICCGSMEPKDFLCYKKLAKRELMEEFKLDFDQSETIIEIYNFPIPLFILYFKEIDEKNLNLKIKLDNENLSIPNYLKEIDHIKLFNKDSNILNSKNICKLVNKSLGFVL